MKCLIAILGPTGVGKSSLGLAVAQHFNGEIINSDSRQIYKHMDIGTAKPSDADINSVPHHLFDIIQSGSWSPRRWHVHSSSKGCWGQEDHIDSLGKPVYHGLDWIAGPPALGARRKGA